MIASSRFTQRREELEAIASEPAEDIPSRVKALCELYFLFQGDVHNQAKFIRRIKDLI